MNDGQQRHLERQLERDLERRFDRHGVPEAEEALERVLCWLPDLYPEVLGSPEDSIIEYKQRLSSVLDRLGMEDSLRQLDVEIARAYMRHVMLTDEPPMVEPTGEMRPQALDPELGFAVDVEMVPLVKALWLRGYRAISSGQEAYYFGNYSEVTFERPADVQRMLAVCAAAAARWDDADFYGRGIGEVPT